MAPLLKHFHQYFGEFAKQQDFVRYKHGYMRIVNDVIHGFNFRSYHGGKSGTIEFGVWPLSRINTEYVCGGNFGLYEILDLVPDFVCVDFWNATEKGMEELLELFTQYLLPYFNQSTDAKSAYKIERAAIRRDSAFLLLPIVQLQELEEIAGGIIEDVSFDDANTARAQFCLQFGDKDRTYCHEKLYISYIELRFIRRLPRMVFRSDEEKERKKEEFFQQQKEDKKRLEWIQNTPIEQIQATLLEEQKKNMELLKWKG